MDTKEIQAVANNDGKRALDWLSEEVGIRLPRYWLVLAGLAALGLFLVAID